MIFSLFSAGCLSAKFSASWLCPLCCWLSLEKKPVLSCKPPGSGAILGWKGDGKGRVRAKKEIPAQEKKACANASTQGKATPRRAKKGEEKPNVFAPERKGGYQLGDPVVSFLLQRAQPRELGQGPPPPLEGKETGYWGCCTMPQIPGTTPMGVLSLAWGKNRAMPIPHVWVLFCSITSRRWHRKILFPLSTFPKRQWLFYFAESKETRGNGKVQSNMPGALKKAKAQKKSAQR